MPTARLIQRLRLALNDSKASQELTDILDSIDPDGDGAIDAVDVVYDPAGSGLSATDVQAAIDEVDGIADTGVTNAAAAQADATQALTDAGTAQSAANAAQADATSAQTDVDNIVTGTATVLNAATTVTVTAATLGGSFGGSPVALTFAEAPTAATLLFATWSTNDLVINIDADNTANLDVYFSVDGR